MDTVIVSPGYYLQRGEAVFVGLFAVLLVLSAGAAVQTLRSFHRT